ncbi:MAG: hypothetical protein FWE78_03705 [Methanimicrococcus sp.]|nr:hypothetical protein [Methanimicrococcus sp.]
MKKTILILILILIAAVVGVAGCLGGDSGFDSGLDSDFDSDSEDDAAEPPSNEPVNPPPNAEIITAFNASVVTVAPLPAGFTHLATRSVVANTQGLGIPDALSGYRNMLTYDNSNIYLSVYRCVPPTTASDQIQEMIVSHRDKYGSDSKISTTWINGHDAVLLEATVLDAPQEGRYILVWSNWSGDEYDNSYLVIVNGQVNYSVIQTLAEASNL